MINLSGEDNGAIPIDSGITWAPSVLDQPTCVCFRAPCTCGGGVPLPPTPVIAPSPVLAAASAPPVRWLPPSTGVGDGALMGGVSAVPSSWIVPIAGLGILAIVLLSARG